MKKFLNKTIGLAALLCAVSAFTAFASTQITEVTFVCGPDTEATIAEGVMDPIFTVESDEYTLASASKVSESSTVYKQPVAYELQFTPNDGYYFPKETYITVTGTGISSITKKKTEDEYIFTVRVKAYPYYGWAMPTFADDSDSKLSDGTSKTITINRGGAPTVEYLMAYTDTYGEHQTKKGSVTGTTISISGYNKKYTGTSEDRTDAEVEGIAIRAIGKAGENTRTAPSAWNTIGSIDPTEFEYTSYETWGDLYGESGSGSSSSGNSSKNNNTGKAKGPGSTVVSKWIKGADGTWKYQNTNGIYAKGWIQDGGNWYYLDATTGVMKTGWFKNTDGKWYYLSNGATATEGSMLKGWYQENGKWYYLNPAANGPEGAMVAGTTMNIGGKDYTFDGDGVCTNPY